VRCRTIDGSARQRANLLLRQAQALHDAQRRGQVLAWVELAKEGYRELLRRHPEDWPARYNLERAQRLLPDPQDADEDPAAPRRGAERAATTMRGYSPGLP
jgi:mxaK protein